MTAAREDKSQTQHCMKCGAPVNPNGIGYAPLSATERSGKLIGYAWIPDIQEMRANGDAMVELSNSPAEGKMALYDAPSTVEERIYTKADMEAACALAVAGFRSKPMLDKMVDRFLAWKLPVTFAPDGGIRFTRSAINSPEWPIGTNLLTADEAKAMLEYVLSVPSAREDSELRQVSDEDEHR